MSVQTFKKSQIKRNLSFNCHFCFAIAYIKYINRLYSSNQSFTSTYNISLKFELEVNTSLDFNRGHFFVP